VCFDQEYYAGKWKNLIGKLIAEQGGKTDTKIILNRGIPDFVPKKTKAVTIGDVEYTLISQSNYSWNETKKKSTANTAWLVSLEWHQSSGSYDVKVSRVEYKVCEKVSYNRTSSEPKDPVRTFMIDLLPDILPEEKKDIAEIMQKKHEYPYGFFRALEERLMETIIDRRLHEEDRESMAALYLAAEFGSTDKKGNWHEIDPDYQAFFDLVFERKFELSQLPKEPWVENVFRILIAVSVKTNNLPELRDNEAKWKQTETSLFWRFAQMTKEEYIVLYQRILTEAIRAEVNAPANGDEEPQEDETNTDMEDPLGDE
jgi:hypothetical protein